MGWKAKKKEKQYVKVAQRTKNREIELPYDSVIPLLGINPDKTITWKVISTPVFTAALFTIAKTQTT